MRFASVLGETPALVLGGRSPTGTYERRSPLWRVARPVVAGGYTSDGWRREVGFRSATERTMLLVTHAPRHSSYWPFRFQGPGATPSGGQAKMKPTTSGYADVNGIKLYHEVYGEGQPLVLIHGGLTTIGEMQGWVQPLARTRQVIAVEMQGHGHTADTNRPMTPTQLGDDIAALLDHLQIPNADLVGHSFGGASAIRTALQ